MERRSFSIGCVTAIAVALMAAGFGSLKLSAQIDTGTITGTITDQSGAVIPHAKVSLTNEETAFTITTTADAGGSYTFTPVKIGRYTVSVEVPGFTKEVHAHLTVNINQDLVVNFTLKPGAVTQVVTA